MNKIIVVEANKCLSCHSCRIACALAHSSAETVADIMEMDERPVPRIILENMDGKILPLHCRQCEDAPCIAVCPTHAMSRDSAADPVTLDQDKCIGCHECVLVCPFGVIKKSRDGRTMIKCDLCYERLKEGKNPACVDACPTKAIKYRSLEEANSAKREKYMAQIRKGDE